MSAFGFNNFILDQSRLSLILLSAISFAFGLCIGKTVLSVEPSSLLEDTITPTPALSLLHEEKSPGSQLTDVFFLLSNKKFSCNAQHAYEHLSKLHGKRDKLYKHKGRGDANRARIQTIDRKASAAEAAELAFRSCIGVMMPELLELWDDKNKRNQMHSKLWDDSKEEAIAGVTFDVLKRTAEELDQTVE